MEFSSVGSSQLKKKIKTTHEIEENITTIINIGIHTMEEVLFHETLVLIK